MHENLKSALPTTHFTDIRPTKQALFIVHKEAGTPLRPPHLTGLRHDLVRKAATSCSASLAVLQSSSSGPSLAISIPSGLYDTRVGTLQYGGGERGPGEANSKHV